MIQSAYTTTRSTYIPFIDGMRALAVLIILLFHLDVSWLGGGFIGVDVFFVISGYLITGHIVSEIKAGTFSLRNFYARRIKRIFPALFFMLVVTSVLVVFFLGPSGYSDFFQAARYSAAQISNFLFVREVDYFDHGLDVNPLLHTWSLAIEEQYYLLWPLCLLMFWRFFYNGQGVHIFCFCIFLFSLCASIYLVHTAPQTAFYMLHSRAWELSVGAMAALRPLSKLLRGRISVFISAACIALILFCAVFYNTDNFPGIKALWPCMAIALLLYIARHRITFIHRALGFKGLTSIGLLSYSLYLWHWPLIAIYKYYFTPELSLMAIFMLISLSFMMALTSYFFVEKPLRYAAVTPAKAIATGILVIVLFIPLTNWVKRGKEASWRTTAHFDRAVSEPTPYFEICGNEGGAYNLEQCVVGPNKENYEIILAGDSHAAHYAPTVIAFAKESNLTVRLFFRGNCRSFVRRGSDPYHKGKRDDYCMKMQDDFFEILRDQKSLRYVFVALLGGGGQDDLLSSLREVETYGKKTFYLGRVPVFENDPLECKIRSTLLATKIIPRQESADSCFRFKSISDDADILESREKLRPYLVEIGIPYFDPYDFLTQPFDGQGNFLYMDDNHLNVFGGAYLAPHLSRFVNEREG